MNPRPRVSLLLIAVYLGWVTVAHAQGGLGDFTIASKLRDAPGDIGVKVSETGILHLGITAEAGYDTNVFYDETAPRSSAVARVTPRILLTNASRTAGQRNGVNYDLGASLVYRQYLSSDENIQAQTAFNPTVFGSLVLSPSRAFSAAFADQFTRSVDPPYAPGTGNIARDHNLASIRLRMQPGGGRIQGLLAYSNGLDYYENPTLQYASNMSHELVLDTHWNWLPKTALFLKVGAGAVSYLISVPATPRHSSYSYHGAAGLRGLVTPKLSVNLGAGYAGAIYEAGPSPQGLSSFLADLGLLYQPGLLTRFGLGVLHGFRNSPIVGNFYDVDALKLAAKQMLGRATLDLTGSYEFRRYQGFGSAGTPVSRNDHVIVGGGLLDYYLKKWCYAGIGYALTFNQSDAAATMPGVLGASYVKHEVVGRIGMLL